MISPWGDGYSRLDRLDGLGITEGDDSAPDLSFDEWEIVKKFGFDEPEAKAGRDWSMKVCAWTLAACVFTLVLLMVWPR